jgi:DNA repair protein RecN (Recombination protein N)
LVEKINGVSTVKELNNSERVNEIARMISGENVTNEAIEFAKNIIKS